MDKNEFGEFGLKIDAPISMSTETQIGLQQIQTFPIKFVAAEHKSKETRIFKHLIDGAPANIRMFDVVTREYNRKHYYSVFIFRFSLIRIFAGLESSYDDNTEARIFLGEAIGGPAEKPICASCHKWVFMSGIQLQDHHFCNKKCMKAHYAVDDVILMFQCPECTAKFPRKDGLKQHLEADHMSMRYVCPKCIEKEYKFKNNLTKHMRDKHRVIGEVNQVYVD